MAQNNKMEEVKQSKGEEGEDGWLRKELEECREQLKKLKSELLRKEYKHDTEMVIIMSFTNGSLRCHVQCKNVPIKISFYYNFYF